MKPIRLLNILVTVAALATALSAGPVTEHSALDGRWVSTDIESAGGGVVVPDSTWVFNGSKVSVYTPGHAAAATFKIDQSKSPAWIDFAVDDGTDQAKSIKGLFKLDGDTLVVIFPANASGPRPTNFGLDGNTINYLVRDGSPTTRLATTTNAVTRPTTALSASTKPASERTSAAPNRDR